MNKKDFDICYKLRNEDETYLAPQVLPNNTSDKYAEWEYRETLRFQYVYNFMPEGIVNRVTVRLSDLITDISEVWNGGVVLSRGSNQALVKEGFHKDGRKIIDISVRGNAYTGKELLILIRHEIDQMNEHSYKGVEVRKYIPCYHEECLKSEHSGFFDYKELLKYLDNRENTIKCTAQKSFHDVSVNKLLEGVGMTKDTKDEARRPNDKPYQEENTKAKGTVTAVCALIIPLIFIVAAICLFDYLEIGFIWFIGLILFTILIYPSIWTFAVSPTIISEKGALKSFDNIMTKISFISKVLNKLIDK